MKKVKLNYWIDVGIAITFALSSISGLVFLLPVDFGSGVLGISYSIWNQLHTWSSVGMIAGVLAHLMLHWKWIISMTKKMLFLEKDRPGTPATATVSTRRIITRRQFLTLGLATLFTGVIAAGCSVFVREWAVDTMQDDETEQPTQQQGGVACPRGLINDPYPGRCRHYTDHNGDGICDYSVPGSGNN